MKNALHTHRPCVCALTHSAACHMSSKKETHEAAICVFAWAWVSVCGCIHTPSCPSFNTYTRTHTPFTPKHIPISTHTFPGVVLAGGEQQWSGTGLFFSAGQTAARPKAAIRSLPRCVWSGTCLNLHLLRGLHFRYIVQASLNTVEGSQDSVLKSTPQDQPALYAGLWGWPPFVDHEE